ncbi:hypothetical protein BBBGCB_BBBGCB_04905, partial [Dysosmobacter welbionis]
SAHFEQRAGAGHPGQGDGEIRGAGAVCLPPVLHPVRAGPVPAGRADLRPHQGGRPGPRLSGGRHLGLPPDRPGGLSGRGGG